MLGSKKFEKVILQLISIALVFSLFVTCFPNVFSFLSTERSDNEYPVKLFGQQVVDIDIKVDEDVWNEMLENRMSKPYIACDLTIDGKEYKSVGLRPKGNSSLTSIQGDRISYRLDFDHYIDNQTCYGLEQMVLNNLQADATYMKDFIAYDLMTYMGVKAPLHTYAFIKINGKPFGVYLAVEVYDEDFLARAFSNTQVQLYNVKSSGLDAYESAVVDPETATVLRSNGTVEAMGMGGPPPGEPPMGGGPGGGMQPPGMPGGQAGMSPPPPPPPMSDSFEGGQPLPGQPSGNMGGERPGMPPDGGMPSPPPGGGGPGSADGGDLVYVDGSTESYSEIFANAVSKNADARDFAKVIRAIYYLNQASVTREELDTYWDVDAALRYLAVHTFMVNGDSYTGNMKQNYFLAEENGRITVLPWDYNLSFGAFSGGPGSSQMTGDKTLQTINHAIDTPVIDAQMESRPLVSVLLSDEKNKEKYHAYLQELTDYVTGDFLAVLERVEKAIYPKLLLEDENSRFYSPEQQEKAFSVLKAFLNLRSESIRKQIQGSIASVTEEQTLESLVRADGEGFSVDDMGSMGGGPGGPGGPGEPGGAPGASGQPDGSKDEPMSPAMGAGSQAQQPSMSGGQMPLGMPPGGQMPPPMPPDGMSRFEESKDLPYYGLIVCCFVLLAGTIVGVRRFKRNY